VSDSLKVEIQRAIGLAVLAGPFFETVYDERTGQMKSIDPDLARKVKPISLEVNESESIFVTDGRYGRSFRQRRDTWTFEAIAAFSKEVDFSFFETKCCEEPILIPTQNTIAFIKQARYSHPTRSGNGGGTEVIFTFETRVGH